jgi:hypothetical protein
MWESTIEARGIHTYIAGTSRRAPSGGGTVQPPVSPAMTPASSETAPKRPLYKSLYVQVLFAVIVGVMLGHFVPQNWARR